MADTTTALEREVDQEIARVNREALNPETVPCPQGCGHDVEPTLLSHKGFYFDPPGTTIRHHCATDDRGLVTIIAATPLSYAPNSIPQCPPEVS